MFVRALAITPGLKHTFTGRQLAILGASVGDDQVVALTTDQQLLVEMEADRVGEAEQVLSAAGMKMYAIGPVVKNVRACNFCYGGEVEGYEFAASLDEAVAGMSVPFSLVVAYAGCPGACSEPLVRDIAVVKKGDGFDIYAGGRPSGLESRPGSLVAEGVAAEKMVAAVRRIIQFYQVEGRGRERFWQFVDRVGVEPLIQSAARFARRNRYRPTGT